MPVTAETSAGYTTDPGNDTMDQVFLLSESEVLQYFGDEVARCCYPTYYAIARGVSAGDWNTCYWWLHTSGQTSKFVTVHEYGLIHKQGESANTSGIALRPAMWIDLSMLEN